MYASLYCTSSARLNYSRHLTMKLIRVSQEAITICSKQKTAKQKIAPTIDVKIEPLGPLVRWTSEALSHSSSVFGWAELKKDLLRTKVWPKVSSSSLYNAMEWMQMRIVVPIPNISTIIHDAISIQWYFLISDTISTGKPSRNPTEHRNNQKSKYTQTVAH